MFSLDLKKIPNYRFFWLNLLSKIWYYYLRLVYKKLGQIVQKNMITTSFELPGYSIVESLGVVRGISVRSTSALGNIGARIETFWGGTISTYVNLCEKTRQIAFDLMIKHAEELGANAVVGLRYDSNEIAVGVTEVLVYGTAAIVSKI